MKKSVLQPLVEQGHGIRPIAKLLETSPTNVRYWIRKYRLELKQKPIGRGYAVQRVPYRCGQCGETDPAKFYGHKRRMCGACHNAYNIKKGQDKRLRAIKELGGRCKVCGFGRFSCSLDLHHKDHETKDPNFRSIRGWSWQKILLELKKCILLCKNCHAAVHAGLLKFEK
ncbi:MAG TPA: helix-turn-helix domain-containing protein [Pyrinomonadaceae bacterium]